MLGMLIFRTLAARTARRPPATCWPTPIGYSQIFFGGARWVPLADEFDGGEILRGTGNMKLPSADDAHLRGSVRSFSVACSVLGLGPNFRNSAMRGGRPQASLIAVT